MTSITPITAEDRWRLWHPRGTLCAVCRQPSRGFGWFDPAPRKTRRPSASFCCIACQGFWSRLAGRSSAVVDLTEQEQAAMRAAMRHVAESMAEIGWVCEIDKRGRLGGEDQPYPNRMLLQHCLQAAQRVQARDLNLSTLQGPAIGEALRKARAVTATDITEIARVLAGQPRSLVTVGPVR